MRNFRFVAAITCFAICSAPICLARQGEQPVEACQEPVPGPCGLRAQVALAVSRDLISLQPMNGYLVEAGLSSWEEMRRSLTESEAARYDACFQNLADAYEFVLEAANAWATVSQTRISIPIDNLLALNSELRMSIIAARGRLQRAAACCLPPEESPKPKE